MHVYTCMIKDMYNFETMRILLYILIQAGYKEREDRITELEEFINDQVTQLDKMATEIKQMTADKQLLEENYQVAKVLFLNWPLWRSATIVE